MTFNKQIESFIKDYLKELEENNAAIFAGAGLSVASGHVDWRGLLREFAEDLGLDVMKENDLIALAQYHLNKNGNNRHKLNQKIANEFHHGKKPNVNHEILARLPIATFWTTNYDKLIERALENASKVVDVKYTKSHLAKTIHGRNAILYKMHGDVEHPSDSILSKDQYEKYYKTHGAYINALSGDLISKTFLFIGFSFTDPNLDYILSRIRVRFKNDQRQHYALMRGVKQEENESNDDFAYRKVRQDLAIQDLLRFNIHVILVSEYLEITNVLAEIEKRYKRRTIYISGSAHEYGNWSPEVAERFIADLSRHLISSNYKIVSGFGLGVGSAVISGVLEEVYINRRENLRNQLLLRPFPQGKNKQELWPAYREDMMSYAGIALFIFGNKLVENSLIPADGVHKEFEIAQRQGVLVIPVGATGYVAETLWKQVLDNYSRVFGSQAHREKFIELGDKDLSTEVLKNKIVQFINSITK